MEIDESMFESDDEESDDDTKLAEIYRLAVRLIQLLDSVKSQELKESASLMLIREILNDDPLLLGLTSKMIQDLSFGLTEDENYVS
jgi:hypothetical protein